MPTLPDLELNDFDLKPYMDPSILLDTFSADDMDIWQSYNLFSDENINSSLKEQIKEENTDIMDCCFSSICPNDLINNSENNHQNNNHNSENRAINNFNNFNQHNLDANMQQHQQEIFNTNYKQQTSNEYYSTTSSSCSSSPSIESNQYFQTDSKTAINLNLDSLNFQQHVIEGTQPQQQNNFVYESTFDNKSVPVEYFQISEKEPSLSPSSSISSASDFSNFNQSIDTKNIQFHQQKTLKEVENLTNLSQQQPIIIVEASQPHQQLKNKTPPTTVSSSHKLSKKSANILPPSPPSSFGSDSESNQSTTSSTTHTTNNKLMGLKSTKLLKSSKLNNQMRSNATIIKQMRHQSYSFKQNAKNSAKANKVSVKTESNLDTSNSLLNLSTNSDDDCWPFLCSLSKLPSSGPIMLTEEEKRTLVQEGHQVPAQLPLTKNEEKILKKIRRKIKNKISAQESRRKKKEYVDSLEKRMESYINENVELKKRLENLELNNTNLMQQLQKLTTETSLRDQSSKSQFIVESQSQITCGTNSNNLNINSANQFGTLLMVLVLFFTVLLGVWSPLITKDSITQASATAATAAAASISVRPTRSPISTYSASGATTTAAVAVASLAVASSVAAVKTESLSPASNTDENNDNSEISSFNKPVIMNDDEDDFLANDAILTGQINNNNLMAKCRAGSAVELTKVKPFIRKLPTMQSNNNTQQASDYIVFNQNQNQQNIELPTASSLASPDNQQIIILNLNNQKIISEIQQTSPTVSSITTAGNVTSTTTNNNNNNNNSNSIPVNLLNGQITATKPLNQNNLISLNGLSGSNPSVGGSGYRVINTVQNNNQNAANAQKLNACTANSTTKLPTRFRLINNGINALNSHQLAPSVIKLNTLA